MSCFYDMKEKDICKKMDNITQTHVVRLYHTGIKLIEEKVEYRNIIQYFVGKRVS